MTSQKKVGSFGVGVDDLIQYTQMIDGRNTKLDKVLDSYPLAIFTMIKMAAENAHAKK